MGLPKILGIWAIIEPKIDPNDACSFQETEYLLQFVEIVKYGTDLVDNMFNILQALELANVSELCTATWKYWHSQERTNIIQGFLCEAIVKYVIGGLECRKHGINLICAKFPQIINGVLFPDGSKYNFFQF